MSAATAQQVKNYHLLTINLVTEDGMLLVYDGAKMSLAEGAGYPVSQWGAVTGILYVEKIRNGVAVCRFSPNGQNAPLKEGDTVTVEVTEWARPYATIDTQAEHGESTASPRHEPSVPAAPPKQTRSRLSEDEDRAERIVKPSKKIARDSGDPVERSAQKEPAGKRPSEARPAVRVPVSPGSNKNESDRLELEPREKNGDWSRAATLRYETHTDYSFPETAFSGLYSGTKRSGSSLLTLFGMYKTCFSDHTFDYLGGGVSYAKFPAPTWYYSLGYSFARYLKINEETSTSDRTSDSLYFGVDKLIGLKEKARNYARVSAAYSTDSDLRSNRMLDLEFDEYMSVGEKSLLSFSYQYTHSFDYKRHIYDQYGVDYSFPAGTNKKAVVGYKVLEKKYEVADGEEKTDRGIKLLLNFDL